MSENRAFRKIMHAFSLKRGVPAYQVMLFFDMEKKAEAGRQKHKQDGGFEQLIGKLDTDNPPCSFDQKKIHRVKQKLQLHKVGDWGQGLQKIKIVNICLKV